MRHSTLIFRFALAVRTEAQAPVHAERKLARDGWDKVLDHLAAHLADKEVRASWRS